MIRLTGSELEAIKQEFGAIFHQVAFMVRVIDQAKVKPEPTLSIAPTNHGHASEFLFADGRSEVLTQAQVLANAPEVREAQVYVPNITSHDETESL